MIRVLIVILLNIFITNTSIADGTFENEINLVPQIAISDGSSIFIFKRTGDFNLIPVGVSGREIAGTWRMKENGYIEITGTWKWENGLSVDDDHRRMIVHISNLEKASEEYTKSITYKNIELWKADLTIKHISKINGNKNKSVKIYKIRNKVWQI
jgi:hypothetical protein